jgi:16S rRNA (uracil1498-N3)-methyltransferase
MMPKYTDENPECIVRLTRCFVSTALHAGDTLSLPEAASTHIGRVLRARPGDALTLFNGYGGEYEALILTIDRRSVRVRIGAQQAVERESPLKVTLLQALARGERMDFIVQKATELGVAAIVMWPGEHSVVRLDTDAQRKRVDHWRGVAVSACEQCGRNRLPAIEWAADLPNAMARTPADDTRLLLSPEATHSLCALAPAARSVTLLIGPEGGFTREELELSLHHGFTDCRLGPRVLRAETAPLAALSVLQALAGDLAH